MQTPARAGWGGRSVCALERSPGGGTAAPRAACPLLSGPDAADRWTWRKSVGQSARLLPTRGVFSRPRAAAALAFSLQRRGWRVGFFPLVCACVYVCVCARYLYGE